MGFFEIKCPSKFDLDHNVMMQVKYRRICMKSFLSVSRQYFVHLAIPSLRASFRFEKYRDKSSANGTRKGDLTRDDSQRRFFNTSLQHCCDIVSNGRNTVPTLQRGVALKIVVANRPV